MPGKRWTKTEDTYLRRWYPIKGPEHCAEQLGRTISACHSRARRIGTESGLPAGFVPLTWVEPEACRHGPTARVKRQAQEDGVLRRVEGRNHKNIVPEWWANQYAEDIGQEQARDHRTRAWLTTEDIARMVGMTRPGMNRNLNKGYALARHLQNVESVMVRRPRKQRRWHPQQARMAINAWRAQRRAA